MEQGRLALAHKSPRGLDYSSQHSLSHLPFQPQVQELPCRNPHTCCHHRDNWTKRKKCKSRRVSVTLSQTHKRNISCRKKRKNVNYPTRQEPVCLNMLSLMWSTCNRQQPAQKHYSFPIGSTTERNRKDACLPRTCTFRDATLLLSRATKLVRGSALFTEKISRAVVNKLRWKSWEFKANRSLDVANCLQVSRKALPWQLTSNYTVPKDTQHQPTLRGTPHNNTGQAWARMLGHSALRSQETER